MYGYFAYDKLDGIIRVNDIFDEYEISFFFVNPVIQSQGIGQKLFQFVLERFGDKRLVLYVYTDNNNAIHIYKKYGFKVVGTDYYKGYRGSDPHYIMKREPKLR